MFTGIIKEVGVVVSINRLNGIVKLKVKASISLTGASVDDSIAINGVCLTIISLEGDIAEFDVLPETIKKTSLNNLESGSSVNIEKSLTLQDKIGGHILQGHVDCTVSIVDIKDDGQAREILFKGDAEYMDMLVKKAYIALDGMSLTIVDVLEYGFKVMIIPHTFSNTIVKNWGIGTQVNMEVDIMNKSIYQYIKLFNEKAK